MSKYGTSTSLSRALASGPIELRIFENEPKIGFGLARLVDFASYFDPCNTLFFEKRYELYSPGGLPVGLEERTPFSNSW